jgi:rhamnosyltransferase
MSNGSPEISIVIRTKNGQPYIGRVLKSVFAQELVDGSFEVIVIDSGSTDGTLNTVKQYAIRLLIEIDPSDFSHAFTFNLGAENARGNYVVYLSQDAEPAHKYWLKYLTQGLCDQQTAATYGRQLPYHNCHVLERKDILRAYPETARIQTSDWFFSNVNSAIKRNTWERHRFDPRLPLGEDQEWAKWALENGFVIRYVPEATVFHSHNYNLREVYERYRAEAIAWRHLGMVGKLRLRDFVRSYLGALYSDSDFLINQKKIHYFPYVIVYRFCQRLGMYIGSRWSDDN